MPIAIGGSSVATLRMLPDTVVLANYIGEVRDVAAYQITIMNHVYCPEVEGSAVSTPGRRKNDSAQLYFFDKRSIATDENGNKRTYLPYELWKALEDKTPYWTLCDGGRDTFRKQGSGKELYVTGFAHYVVGTARMWHFEVFGS